MLNIFCMKKLTLILLIFFIFQGVDYFKFGVSGSFASMSIFYDTYPTREAVGDKYK